MKGEFFVDEHEGNPRGDDEEEDVVRIGSDRLYHRLEGRVV